MQVIENKTLRDIECFRPHKLSSLIVTIFCESMRTMRNGSVLLCSIMQ